MSDGIEALQNWIIQEPIIKFWTDVASSVCVF